MCLLVAAGDGDGGIALAHSGDLAVGIDHNNTFVGRAEDQLIGGILGHDGYIDQPFLTLPLQQDNCLIQAQTGAGDGGLFCFRGLLRLDDGLFRSGSAFAGRKHIGQNELRKDVTGNHQQRKNHDHQQNVDDRIGLFTGLQLLIKVLVVLFEAAVLLLLHLVVGHLPVALAHIGLGETSAADLGSFLQFDFFRNKVFCCGFSAGLTDPSANGTLFGTVGIFGAAYIANNLAHDKPPVESYSIPFLRHIITLFYKKNNYKRVAFFVILFYDSGVKGGDIIVRRKIDLSPARRFRHG